jgi:beta-phosphoglucomutase family hydrolase
MKKAVIFDMDGVISDTQEMHSKSWAIVLDKYGIKLPPEEITLRFAGMSAREAFSELLKEYSLERFLEDAIKEKTSLLRKVSDHKIRPIKGVKVWINRFIKEGRDIAVATGSGHSSAMRVLTELELLDVFPVIVTADDVDITKPAPDVFLKAAEKLGRDPKECIVIEDSRNGMMAAHLAGMKCVGLVANREDTDIYPADKLVESYSELETVDFE